MKREINETVWLVRAAQSGDREAMTVLYERTFLHISRNVHAIIHDEALAEDVIQETYLRAFTNLHQLKEPEKLLSWLRSIAAAQAKNALSRKRPLLFSEMGGDIDPMTSDTATPAPSPEQSLLDKERLVLVGKVLEKLSDGQRLILGMYYSEQLSTREIAARLGISQNTVRSQLSRGRRRMRLELRRLRQSEDSLPGFVLLPSLLRHWRKAAGQTGGVRTILSQLPAKQLVYTTGRLLLPQVAAVAATICVLAAGVYGMNRLQELHRLGDVQPVLVPTEIRVQQTEPVEAEPAEPTEPPTEPTEAPTEEPLIEVPEETEDTEVSPVEDAPPQAPQPISVSAGSGEGSYETTSEEAAVSSGSFVAQGSKAQETPHPATTVPAFGTDLYPDLNPTPEARPVIQPGPNNPYYP